PLAVTISGLTLTGGNTGGNGGAIYAENISLNLQNVVLSGNTAHDGGAVYGKNGNAATTVFSNTVMQGNNASHGGAFRISGGASTTISNSTVSGNNATTCCGGGDIENSG